MNVTLRADWTRIAPNQAGQGLVWYRRFTARRVFNRPETGVVFTVEPAGLTVFARVTPDHTVELWVPTPCCNGLDVGGDEEVGKCDHCEAALTPRYFARWAPPASPRYNMARLADEWLTEACDNVLEASLLAPELASRMDQVFKHKVLADPVRSEAEFKRVLAGVTGPL